MSHDRSMFAKIIAALQKAGPNLSVAQAEQRLTEARAELDAALQVEADAKTGFEASKLAVDDRAMKEAHERVLLANMLTGRGRAVVEMAEQCLAEAQARDAEKARVARYALAGAKSAAARKALAEYQQHAEAIRSIIRVVAEADAAIAAANSDLPTATEPLLHPEQMVRGLPAEPAITLSTRTDPATWVFAEGVADDAVPANLVKQIEVVGQEGAIRYGRIISFENGVRVERRVIGRPGKRIRTVLPGVPAYRPESLASEVSLPGFAPGEGPVWVQCGRSGFAGSPLGQDGNDVLAVAADLAAAEPAGDPRPLRQKTEEWAWLPWADEAAERETAA